MDFSTLRMAELYYTRNGLPINEDLSFNYSGRYDLLTIPADRKIYAKPGLKTAYLHIDREPRFYSSTGLIQENIEDGANFGPCV